MCSCHTCHRSHAVSGRWASRRPRWFRGNDFLLQRSYSHRDDTFWLTWKSSFWFQHLRHSWIIPRFDTVYHRQCHLCLRCFLSRMSSSKMQWLGQRHFWQLIANNYLWTCCLTMNYWWTNCSICFHKKINLESNSMLKMVILWPACLLADRNLNNFRHQMCLPR